MYAPVVLLQVCPDHQRELDAVLQMPDLGSGGVHKFRHGAGTALDGVLCPTAHLRRVGKGFKAFLPQRVVLDELGFGEKRVKLFFC